MTINADYSIKNYFEQKQQEEDLKGVFKLFLGLYNKIYQDASDIAQLELEFKDDLEQLVNIKDEKGLPVLAYAVFGQLSSPVLCWFLNKLGKDVIQSYRSDPSLISIAASSGVVSVLEYLLQYYDPNYEELTAGLFCAAFCGHSEIFDFIEKILIGLPDVTLDSLCKLQDQNGHTLTDLQQKFTSLIPAEEDRKGEETEFLEKAYSRTIDTNSFTSPSNSLPPDLIFLDTKNLKRNLFIQTFAEEFDKMCRLYFCLSEGELTKSTTGLSQLANFAKYACGFVTSDVAPGLKFHTPLGSDFPSGVAVCAMIDLFDQLDRWRERNKATEFKAYFSGTRLRERTNMIYRSALHSAHRFQRQIDILSYGINGVPRLAKFSAIRVILYMISGESNLQETSDSWINRACRYAFSKWTGPKPMSDSKTIQKISENALSQEVHYLLTGDAEEEALELDIKYSNEIGEHQKHTRWIVKEVFEHSGICTPNGEKYRLREEGAHKYGYINASREEAIQKGMVLEVHNIIIPWFNDEEGTSIQVEKKTVANSPDRTLFNQERQENKHTLFVETFAEEFDKMCRFYFCLSEGELVRTSSGMNTLANLAKTASQFLPTISISASHLGIPAPIGIDFPSSVAVCAAIDLYLHFHNKYQQRVADRFKQYFGGKRLWERTDIIYEFANIADKRFQKQINLLSVEPNGVPLLAKLSAIRVIRRLIKHSYLLNESNFCCQSTRWGLSFFIHVGPEPMLEWEPDINIVLKALSEEIHSPFQPNLEMQELTLDPQYLQYMTTSDSRARWVVKEVFEQTGICIDKKTYGYYNTKGIEKYGYVHGLKDEVRNRGMSKKTTRPWFDEENITQASDRNTNHGFFRYAPLQTSSDLNTNIIGSAADF
ncbi:MAG: hypothetical protein Q8R24_03550 [Legionellaceae bacterium]|nr:hypothetical protein [Legionellaceae bacterium]